MAPTATMTLDYKRSDEYKNWKAAIKAEHPDLADYFIDMVIYHHKTHPRGYKESSKARQARYQEPAPKSKEAFTVVEDAVRVYDAGELPAAPLVKVVEA